MIYAVALLAALAGFVLGFVLCAAFIMGEDVDDA
jgi:hypothetical protein